MKNNMKKGFAGILFLILVASILLTFFILVLAADFKRFTKVGEAKNEDELITACKKYEMSTIDNIPQRCFPYIEAINTKSNNQH